MRQALRMTLRAVERQACRAKQTQRRQLVEALARALWRRPR
jgi:hypothetical protein